jgi:hypothetical protein
MCLLPQVLQTRRRRLVHRPVQKIIDAHQLGIRGCVGIRRLWLCVVVVTKTPCQRLGSSTTLDNPEYSPKFHPTHHSARPPPAPSSEYSGPSTLVHVSVPCPLSWRGTSPSTCGLGRPSLSFSAAPHRPPCSYSSSRRLLTGSLRQVVDRTMLSVAIALLMATTMVMTIASMMTIESKLNHQYETHNNTMLSVGMSPRHLDSSFYPLFVV